MKHITYNIVRIMSVFVLCVTCYMLHVTWIHAVNMNSNQYRIQFGTIDIGGNRVDNTDYGGSYNLTSSLGQTAAKQFESSGYIVKAGFQYVYSRIPFTFSVSNIRADLGTLLPSTPSTAAINLSVSFGGAGQYIVTAAQTSQMKNFNGNAIPNTSCDGGINTCLTTLAKPWTSAAAYGFGFNMSGADIPADFTNNTYYRPFADLSVPESPATVMQSTDVTANISPTPNPSYTPAPALTGTPRNTTHTSTMTFKANISPIQPAGSYYTVIKFLATPSF